MSAHELDARSAEITAEEARLRKELRGLEDEVHSRLRRDTHANADKIEAVEKQIRAVVLRLSALEQEQIEITIARSL